MKHLLLIACLLGVALAQGQPFRMAGMVTSTYTPQTTNDTYYNLLTPDVNGDSIPDLVLEGGQPAAQSASGSVATSAVVMLGDGRGGFTFNRYLPKPSSLHIITDIADYNRDGYLDMLMYSFWQNGFYLYRGQAGGVLAMAPSPQFFATGTHGGPTYFKDYDQDGDLDLLSLSGGSAAVPALNVFTNTGTAFSRASYPMQNLIPETGWMFRFGDANADGRLDLVIGDQNGGYAMLQTATRGFVAQHSYFNTGLIFQQVFMDGTGDGKLDAIVLDEGFGGTLLDCYRGASSSQAYFATPAVSSSMASTDYFSRFPWTTRPLVADVDSNQIDDIIAADKNKLFVHANPFTQGAARLHELTFMTDAGFSDHTLLFSDVDRDGNPDLILHTIAPTDGRKIRVFINQGPQPTVATRPAAVARLTLSPNPAKGSLALGYAGQARGLEMLDARGRVVLRQAKPGKRVDVSALVAGLYTLRLQAASGAWMAERVVIE